MKNKTSERCPNSYSTIIKSPKKTKAPIRLEGRPKYFQLSHDYENCPNWPHTGWDPSRYNGANEDDDRVYAEPIILSDSSRENSNEGSLYYASSELITPLKHRGRESPLVSPYAEGLCLIESYEKELPKTPKEVAYEKNGKRAVTRKFAFKKSIRDSSAGGLPSPLVKQDSDAVEGQNFTASLERRLTRARLVRRKTLAPYDSQVKAFVNRKAPQLFETAFLIELRSDDENASNSSRPSFRPEVTYRFPEGATQTPPPELFFPDFSHNPVIEPTEIWGGDQQFVVALTDGQGARKHAYCVKFLPESREEAVTPLVFVIVSPIKCANFYLELAERAVDYVRTSSLTSLEGFLKSVFGLTFPKDRGTCLVVVEQAQNGMKRRIELRNTGSSMGKRGISDVMQKMSPEIVVSVIAALLGDQRVLIAGSTVSEVAQAVQCLEALLLPLVWPHTYVPVVPDNLTDLAHNPTPYLMGILRSNLAPLRELIIDNANNDDKVQMDFMFVDIENGQINPRPEHFDCSKDKEAWRTNSAQAYCKKLGMPKKASGHLMKGFKGAMGGGPSAAADAKIENAMLHWYALLFGHYKAAGAHTEWGDKMKAKLIASHPNPSMRPYLAYLCETAMFTEWVEKKQRSDSTDDANGGCGNDDTLNRRLDEYASQQSSSSSTSSSKPFSNLVTKVSNALSLAKKK